MISSTATEDLIARVLAQEPAGVQAWAEFNAESLRAWVPEAPRKDAQTNAEKLKLTICKMGGIERAKRAMDIVSRLDEI